MADKMILNNNIYYTALYMRLSKEDGDKDESDSISNQRVMLSKYINERDGFVIYSEYIDDGYSGTNFNRPGFQKMIDEIEIGRANCVIVKDLSRFGRDYIDAGYYLERYFVDKNVRFIAINDNIDSFVRDYDMLMPVKNLFNAQYARDISQKVQSAFKVKQNLGEFIGAFPSYGYEKSLKNKNKLIVDEYAAVVVGRIFQMYLYGDGKMRIARVLNEEGILCPSAYKKACGENYSNCNILEKTSYWTYSTIHKILSNEMYLGNMVQGKTKRRMKGKARQLQADEWIIVKNTHEAIIDDVIWDNVQRLLQRETRQLSLNDNKSIFAGVLRCGDCERAMAKKRRNIKRDNQIINMKYSYQCGSYTRYGKEYCTSHYIEHELLVQLILKDLNKIVQSIDDLKKIIEEINKAKPRYEENYEVQKRRLEAELLRVQKLKQELYEDYKEGLISKKEYLSYRNDYEDREGRLETQCSVIEDKITKYENQNIFENVWIKKLLELKTIDNLERNIITDMIDVIYIYEDNKIRIKYNFSNELENLFEESCRLEQL